MGFFIELGIMIGIIILASGIVRSLFPKGRQAKKEHTPSVSDKQRSESLKTYERLVKDKLDVVKTAVAMGYSENELEQLDARLEKLIGADKLKDITRDGKAPTVDAELLNTDLATEIEKLRKSRNRE